MRKGVKIEMMTIININKVKFAIIHFFNLNLLSVIILKSLM
jgi:hypothetical protein